MPKLCLRELEQLCGVSRNTIEEKIRKKGLYESKKTFGGRDVKAFIFSEDELKELIRETANIAHINKIKRQACKTNYNEDIEKYFCLKEEVYEAEPDLSLNEDLYNPQRVYTATIEPDTASKKADLNQVISGSDDKILTLYNFFYDKHEEINKKYKELCNTLSTELENVRDHQKLITVQNQEDKEKFGELLSQYNCQKKEIEDLQAENKELKEKLNKSSQRGIFGWLKPKKN